jgi:hypothetical protein
MRKACAHMDSVREQIHRQFGVQDIGVELIRELRGTVDSSAGEGSIGRLP